MAKLEVVERPENIDEYYRWLKSPIGVDITRATQTHYESVMFKVKSDLERSEFWKSVLEMLRTAGGEYLVSTGYNLFQDDRPLQIVTKSFDSVVDKSFRKNVLQNRQWPNPPRHGTWIVPPTWLSQINDLVRTLVVVKYMDGVEFVMVRIKKLCDLMGLSCDTSFEAREEGYYAAHVYIKYNFEVPRLTWDTERVDLKIEFQITTQLQEVIRNMTHKHYETRRSMPQTEEIKWQWNHKSDEFVPYYLGHILHYVEGMIMEIREKQRRT